MRAITAHRFSSRCHRGFTLVELMATIGIIAVLMAILIPVVTKARRTAAVARTKRDLETIRVALDEYKNVFMMYPQIAPFTAGTNVNNVDGIPMYTDNGAHALYTALALRSQVRVSRTTDVNSKAIVGGGAAYGPFVNKEQMKTAVDIILPNSPQAYLCDANGHPILYIPASRIPVNYTGTTAATGLYVAQASITKKPVFYDFDTVPQKVPDPNDSTQTVAPFKNGISDMQKLMGDTNGDGIIDPTTSPPEQAAYTGPYLLWTAGADGQFGINMSTNKSDDITNFDIPLTLREN